MKEVTKEEEYLENPNFCPYCGSGDIVTGEREYTDLRVIVATVTCDTCHSMWYETYKLKAVYFDEIRD